VTRPDDTTRTFTLPLASEAGLRRRFMVLDEPLKGNLRFGLLLEVLDKLAEETSLEHLRRSHPEARVVTAAVDSILVRNVPDLTRDILFSARVNHVGKSSMEVGIRVVHPGDPPVHIASCYFTMVGRMLEGEGARSVAVPPVEYQDELERKRAHKATLRREAYRAQLAAAEEPPSREEYRLLAELHQAQEQPGFQGLLAGRLVTEAWERMYPEQENVPRTIFGGYVMRRAYEVSSICAERVAPDRPVLAAVNRVNFFHPVRLGDILRYTTRVVCTGNCLVGVEARIERRSRDRSSRALSNSCLFTFVNVDRDLRPRPVPPIYPATYSEDASYLWARRQHLELARHTQHGWVAAA
jgi:acyl-CoA hydrolase